MKPKNRTWLLRSEMTSDQLVAVREKDRIRCRKRYAKNRERINASAKARRAADPEAARIKDREFRKRVAGEKTRAKKRAYYYANLEREQAARRESARRSRIANPDRARARVTNWRKSNPEKVIISNLGTRLAYIDVTGQQIIDLILVWGCCAYCGSTDRKLTIDHVVPVSKGGTHTISNLVPACRPCNSSKFNRSLEEWKRVG